jgi:hypothetical protein
MTSAPRQETIDAIVDANADSGYCRISAEVESATT